MSFNELTEDQRELIINLVEKLASGQFKPEFWTIATHGKGWFLNLIGMGGAENQEIGGFSETDLHALANEDYLTLLPKEHGYAGSLKQKAFLEYKKITETGLEAPEALAHPERMAIVFDENQLANIEETSERLLEELKQNYSLSRNQATSWFRWTLGVSILGFVLIAIGIALVFFQMSTIAISNSIGGIIAEFLAFVFLKQANEANKRQDNYHSDLIKRQQILDAVQLARLISTDIDRDIIIEKIIQSLLGLEA